MNDKELKELAEFAAEFLELKPLSDPCVWILDGSVIMPNDMFEDDWPIPPILAHLAKRKMEGVGYQYLIGHTFGTDSVSYMAKVFLRKNPSQEAYEEDKNEYIALWMAIREAVEG